MARIARGERVEGIDWPHVLEEIAEVGTTQLHDVQISLRHAILRLLQMYRWPTDRSAEHWKEDAGRSLDDAALRLAPSMRHRLDLQKIWQRRQASLSRGAVVEMLPAECPWTLDDLLAGDIDALLAALPPTSG